MKMFKYGLCDKCKTFIINNNLLMLSRNLLFLQVNTYFLKKHTRIIPNIHSKNR